MAVNYYFPGAIDTINIPRAKGVLKYSVNSGENAVRLVLKSYGLLQLTKVAVPMFVCDSLKNAVIKEQLQPVYFDLKETGYWTYYNLDLISEAKCKAIILVHLYGFLHPDTRLIEEYCRVSNVFLIHDMAQCYGADESLLTYGNIIYSFGPGKSTTAAGGGLIQDINEVLYKENIEKPSLFSDSKAMFFMKSRIYGYRFTGWEKMAKWFISKVPNNESIQDMTTIQKDAAEYAMLLVSKVQRERRKRYDLLKDAIKENILLSIAYHDDKGLYFKCVLYVKGEIERFKKYLSANNVPFYSLFNSVAVGLSEAGNMVNFNKNAGQTIELSTESSIPLNEIERVGDILKKYN